jgi:hypothetical protein
MGSQSQNPVLTPPYDLVGERLGPLPVINHFIGQLGLEAILERYVPTSDRRCRLPYAKGLGILIRSISERKACALHHLRFFQGPSPRPQATSLHPDHQCRWRHTGPVPLRSRQHERLERAKEELGDLDQKLQGPRARQRSRRQLADTVGEILGRLGVADYLKADIWTEEIHRFRQERKGRPDKDTRYRRETTRRLRVRWTVEQARIEYDEKSDGMYPLLTTDRSLTARQVLEAHTQQPNIEKRFKQIKTVHEIAPVFLKNEGRIEALFYLYFIALPIQALIERERRRAMQREQIDTLPLYPENRDCQRPTILQILRLLEPLERHAIFKDRQLVQAFPAKLSDIQAKVIGLLAVPKRAYG